LYNKNNHLTTATDHHANTSLKSNIIRVAVEKEIAETEKEGMKSLKN